VLYTKVGIAYWGALVAHAGLFKLTSDGGGKCRILGRRPSQWKGAIQAKKGCARLTHTEWGGGGCCRMARGKTLPFFLVGRDSGHLLWGGQNCIRLARMNISEKKRGEMAAGSRGGKVSLAWGQ